MKSVQNCRIMKNIYLTLIFTGLFISLNAREMETGNTPPEARNAISISYGGGGMYFSLIYERHLIRKESYNIGVKGGMGTSFSSVLFPGEYNISVAAFFLYGKRMHHLDFSANVTGYFLNQYNYTEDETNKELRLLYIPSICYRYQKQEGGFVARAGISPIFNFNAVTNSFTPWVDVSVGWAF